MLLTWTRPCFQSGQTLEPPPVGHAATLGSEPAQQQSQGCHAARKLCGYPGYDGAYPQPQWDCACSTYNPFKHGYIITWAITQLLLRIQHSI